MFEQKKSPKELRIVEGAGHIDYMRYNKEEYSARVINFINKHQ